MEAGVVNMLYVPLFREVFNVKRSELHHEPHKTYGLVLGGSCCNSDLESIGRLHYRAALIIYNLPKDMASEDVLRYVQWPTLSIYYKLDVLGLFYRAKNIGQNRVSAYFI